MTMHALDLNYRSQGSRCLLGVGWIIINYYNYIPWRHGVECHSGQVSPNDAAQAMHSTCCSRRLDSSKWSCFFSSFPIQSIICNARPFDVPCSFWSCCTWWPEHRCGGGDQTESWTDTCPGWLECSVNKQLLLYQDWRHSCVQDVAAMEMISPSSSASEMEPVKDPNQCWLILWKRVRSV